MVKCPNCGFDNLDDSRFCGQCGKITQVPGPVASTYYSQSSQKPKRTIMVLAIVVIAVIIIAAIGVIALQSNGPSNSSSNPLSSDPLYAHILFSVEQIATENPKVQLSVDINGDGIYEVVQNYYPVTYTFGFIYMQSSIQNVVIKLDSSAKTFSYRIQVFNGTKTLFYMSDKEPYDTFSGNISDSSTNQWNFTPDITNSDYCYLLTSYEVSYLNANNTMPQ
jgi:hypothetical protein